MDTNNTSKMSWLKLDDNWNFKYRIANTKKRYGTVCIPTGCGKSGVAIEDIMWRIKKVFDGECENLYINVSTPIQIPMGNEFFSIQADLLDAILPGVLALGLIMAIYSLLKDRLCI